MAKVQAVWAIDIGQAAIKALKLVPGETADLVLAEAFDFIEYPKILSQPDADPDELVREALATFTDRNDLKGCKVAIAVPGQSGLVKFIKLPPVEKKRIPDIVKFEARQQIPFQLDEVVWAYQQIGGDDDGGDDDFTMAEVGLFAMKRDQINRAILPLTVSGIEVDIVQMSPLALYNFIAFDQLKGSGSKDSVVLIDIGADNTDLIITDGVRIWQRNVPIGGNHFTRALTKELKLTFAKAEHLKRNATKAPDPRAIFTAMRGIFNDFSSEISRSIGFYSSINRSAKIKKIVGMGNGFKLPGLQKFLQQNLSQEVERMESFEKMVGDEVKTAPQFQDNLASFAVAYGLGLQGLKRGPLSTNLLPPEMERIRLVRAKKPWALAASALVMLGLTFLFALGDHRMLAGVTTPAFKAAVAQAKSATARGDDIQKKFDAAKGEWTGKFDEGKALIVDPSDRALWPQFLSTLSSYFPDPEREYNLDADSPAAQDELEKLRVYIDAIKPVWRADVSEWFTALDPKLKLLMHPYDAANPPTGEGWIVQIVGHHYNPFPKPKDQIEQKKTGRIVDYGPVEFITAKVLKTLNSPQFRLYGVKSVALGWMTIDKSWTSGEASKLANSTVPLLARASAPEGTPEGGGGGMGAMMGGKEGRMMGSMGPGAMGGQMGGQMSGGGRGRMMGNMMGEGGFGGGANDPEAKKKLKTLTRTDFLIQFVWQPTKPDEAPKTDEERKEERKGALTKIRDEMTQAEKNNPAVTIPKEDEIDAVSRQQSKVIDSAITKALTGPTGATPGPGGTGPAGPGAAMPSGPAPTPPAGAAPAAPAPK